jgi:hypothetical protein
LRESEARRERSRGDRGRCKDKVAAIDEHGPVPSVGRATRIGYAGARIV